MRKFLKFNLIFVCVLILVVGIIFLEKSLNVSWEEIIKKIEITKVMAQSPPSLRITFARCGSDYTITATAVIRAYGGIYPGSVTLNGKPISYNCSPSGPDSNGYYSATCNASAKVSGPGTYTISASITDGQGKSASDSRTVTCTAPHPSVKITSANCASDRTITIAGNIYAYGGVTNYSVVVNGQQITNFTYNCTDRGDYNYYCTASGKAPAPGTYNISVSITDGQGRSASDSVSVNCGSGTHSPVALLDMNCSAKKGGGYVISVRGTAYDIDGDLDSGTLICHARVPGAGNGKYDVEIYPGIGNISGSGTPQDPVIITGSFDTSVPLNFWYCVGTAKDKAGHTARTSAKCGGSPPSVHSPVVKISVECEDTGKSCPGKVPEYRINVNATAYDIDGDIDSGEVVCTYNIPGMDRQTVRIYPGIGSISGSGTVEDPIVVKGSFTSCRIGKGFWVCSAVATDKQGHKGTDLGKCTATPVPPSKKCSDCGKGLLNICDRQECLGLGDCYFVDGNCYSCQKNATCDSYYNDEITCKSDPCHIGNCIWEDGRCRKKITECIGDINNDKRVDIYDLAVLISHWGQENTADLNKDGTVDFEDLKILMSHFGESCD